mgnify:FL=1
MKRKKYFCKEAEVLAGLLGFLNENGFTRAAQRVRVIRYLLNEADEQGIVRTTYKKVVQELDDIELNTVGQTFRLLMKSGLVSMTRTERGIPSLTEYEIRTDKLREIIPIERKEDAK